MKKDKIIRATGKKAPFRLVLVDLTETMNEIGKKHGALSYSLKLMAETTISSIFLSSSLKMKGTVSVTASFAGELSYVKADTSPVISRKEDEESFYFVRAMAPFEELAEIKSYEPALAPKHYQVVKLNEFGKRVHESIIEAVSPSMGQNLAAYLLQSEQVRSAVGIESAFNQEDPSKLDYAVGFYIEAFPELEERDIFILEDIVLHLPSFSTMFKERDGDILSALMYQFSGAFDIEVVKEFGAKAYCPCSKERTVNSLMTLSRKDLEDLAAEGKNLEMICDFCRTAYEISIEDLTQLIEKKK